MSYADDKVEQRLFEQSSGRNSKTNKLIWTVCDIFRDFIHVHLIHKFQKDLIKTERVMLIAKSNRGNQGDITLRLISQSGQVSSSSEISAMSTLSASFRKNRLN